MEIFKIVSIGVIGTFLAMTVRAYKAELGVLTALTTAFLMLYFTVPQISDVVSGIRNLAENSAVDSVYVKAVIKIIGIAYITQFASELAKDANETLLSKKMELVGKIGIIALMMPIINGLLSAIINTLADF